MARKIGTGAGALFLTLFGTSALHAITADQVWTAWQRQYADAGYQLALGPQERQGDTLSLRDLRLTNSANGTTVTFDVPELRLQERQDGTVRATFAPEMTGHIQSVLPVTPPDAPTEGGAAAQTAETETIEMALRVAQKDTEAVVSGTPESLSYTLDAPEVTLDLTQAPDPDKAPGAGSAQAAVPMAMRLVASGVKGIYHVEQGAASTAQKMTSDLTIAATRISAGGADSESGATFALTGDIADIVLHSVASLPEGGMDKDVETAFAKGLSVEGSASYGANAYRIESQSAESQMQMDAASKSGKLTVAMDAQALNYSASSEEAQLSLTHAMAEQPLRASLAAVNLDFAMPLSRSDVPKPFTGKLTLADLTLSDEVWNQFDPAAKLTRTPATLALDLTGTARPLADLYRTDVAAIAGGPALAFDSLNVNRLHLALAGAELNGTGAFTFENPAGGAAGAELGHARPVGAADLSLTGGNKLMADLVAAGFVPQQQAMLVRALLGLYAAPTGDDGYRAKIEFTPAGEILANGQRIQ